MQLDDYIDNMTRAFLECAAWADCPEDSDANTFTKQTRKQAYQYCKRFVKTNQTLVNEYMNAPQNPWLKSEEWRRYQELGHDLWLTVQGQGAGFWDRGLGALGERLTDVCRAMPSLNLYVSRQNKISIEFH